MTPCEQDQVSDMLNAAAWSAFIHFAYTCKEMREDFTTDTGMSLLPTTGIDALIDIATGYRDITINRFIRWATEKHYGLDYAPLLYQKEIAALAESEAAR